MQPNTTIWRRTLAKKHRDNFLIKQNIEVIINLTFDCSMVRILQYQPLTFELIQTSRYSK